MKAKKISLYLISFCFFVALFSGCYYLSFKAALKQFNRDAIEKNNKLVQTVEKSRTPEAEKELVPVDSVVDTVKPSTNYTLEVYDLKNNTFTKESLGTPDFLIGRNREEIINYLSDYMRNVPLVDYEKGLISYELVSFSSTDVVLRKTYNSDNMKYKYYIIILDGFVTVYYSDKKTVYEYTEIEAKDLTEEEQNKLIDGLYVKDQEELYGLLENYTS